MQTELFCNADFRQRALEFILGSVIRGEDLHRLMMGASGPEGINCQIGGYVADPVPWDYERPLRRLKAEVAVWDRIDIQYFNVDDLAREIREQIPPADTRRSA